MTVVSISMIIEVNKQLQEAELPYKIHLSDACGKQSMSIEALNDEIFGNIPDEVFACLDSYFQKQHILLEYSPDKHAFWTK